MVLSAFLGCKKKYIELPLAQLKQGPSLHAEVEHIYIEDFGAPTSIVVVVALKTKTGERVSFASERAEEDLVDFARSLEKGKSYEFPTAWQNYHKNKTKQ